MSSVGLGIMRSGVFKSIRKEINNSVWGGGGGKAEGRGEEERGRRW